LIIEEGKARLIRGQDITVVLPF